MVPYHTNVSYSYVLPYVPTADSGQRTALGYILMLASIKLADDELHPSSNSSIKNQRPLLPLSQSRRSGQCFTAKYI
eukprot:scaffold3414_cov114-Skeletonema_menzelii.AAC.1